MQFDADKCLMMCLGTQLTIGSYRVANKHYLLSAPITLSKLKVHYQLSKS